VQGSNPYIGPAAFTENESSRFFGRTDETRELASRVIARKAVLLYAQSGAGKTSLLQASLIPELRQRKRGETFPIARVTGSVETAGNIYVENALAKLFPDSPGSMAGMTFSEAFGTVLSNDPCASTHSSRHLRPVRRDLYTSSRTDGSAARVLRATGRLPRHASAVQSAAVHAGRLPGRP
jgi:hypothetical protein